jgi:hypothetical protein
MAWSAEFDTAIASAPRARAFTKSASMRRPPVAIRVTSELPVASRCRRARPIAAIVGTEMFRLNRSGAAPVPPPRPSRIT